jgi:hypothetical protein
MPQTKPAALTLAEFGVEPVLALETIRRCETWLTKETFVEKMSCSARFTV